MSNLPCPPEHWRRFSELLDAAIDVPETGRPGWLRSLQGDDLILLPWLTRVLFSSAGLSTGDFLRTPALPAESDAEFAAFDMVGPYRLESVLGEGGMGQVWRASRADDGPQREVALKLPHRDLLGGPFRQRFRRERDVLAGLSHPHIAALYDAGVSAEGHPYLALELVQGQIITAFCQATAASLDRRIDLLRQVLEALSYAHSQLIVHRDIKPSNVMVTPEGQVKLLDFGIAKLLDSTAPGITQLTQPAARMATPGYAAPEQMDGGAVTVSADLFAAGVLLYELCTGKRPPRLQSGGEEAPLASSRGGTAFGRSAEHAGMARALRGDLDAIMAKALSIDPAARYGSADAFARDLRRWREGLPVSARRIGWATLATKFVRRNKLGVGLAAVLALALAGGTAGIAWQARRAEREAARATAIKDFLIGLFEQGDPRSGKSTATMTAKALLDVGADRADAAFAGDPATEIELLTTLGSIYDAVSDGERAESVRQRRFDLSRRIYGLTNPTTVDSAFQLALTCVEFQDDDRARSMLDSIHDQLFALYGPESLQRAEYLDAYAASLRSKHGGRDAAIADDLQAIALFERHYLDSPAYPGALQDLAGYQYDAEQYQQSLETLRKVQNFEKSRNAYDVVDDMMISTDMADRLEHLGRLDEADALYAHIQDLTQKHIGTQSQWYLHAAISRAVLAHLRGDRQHADSLFEQAMGLNLNKARATGQPNSLRRAYGAALAREGRATEAIPLLEQVLVDTRQHQRDEPNLRRTEGMLGDAYDQAGRTAEARPLLLAARDEWIRYGPPGSAQSLAAQERWGRFLLDHGDAAAAATQFVDLLRRSKGAPSMAAAMAEAGLARIGLQTGATAEADAHSGRAVSLIAATTLEYDVRRRIDVWLVRAAVLRAQGQADQAAALARKAVAAATGWDAPASPQLAAARSFAGP